ncbi:MAG: MarR family transcriptional regulator, partial [Actinobacteria bacterium]|nr:MarR family transcriptional regulator [Actinomycetota bacterium]
MKDVARAVERVGQTMESMGIPRMPARVFAFLLVDDRTTYTAADLARGLDA